MLQDRATSEEKLTRFIDHVRRENQVWGLISPSGEWAFCPSHECGLELSAFDLAQRLEKEAALIAEGTKAGEFFAVVSPGKEGLLEVSLKHQSHPDDSHSLGDQCGRRRTAFYDPKTGKILRFQFAR